MAYRSLLSIAFIVGWALALTACEQAVVATPTPVIITITGSTSMEPVLYELTTAYGRRHPEVRFDLRGGGSTLGEERVQARQADLAASTLTGREALTSTVAAGRRSLVRIPIGIDGLAIVVHASNVITSLTTAEVRALYSGQILDWAELGSESGEVLLVSREDGSGSRTTFERRIMGDEAVSLTAVVMPSSADVVAYVARNPQAIGYVSRAHLVDALDDRTAPPGTPTAASAVRMVPLDGELPTPAALREERYGLTQPLLLVSVREPQGPVRDFVDFVLSPAGQAIVERYHARVR
jgi:phosphate transport system substrate-binding protein